MDRTLKKDAFYLYKAVWSKEPFVHICGSRYVDRPEEKTVVKVYSNRQEISLYLDGKLLETKEHAPEIIGGFHSVDSVIYEFTVPLSGSHTIEAVSGQYADRIAVRKTVESNPDYQMTKRENVVNWFDRDCIDAGCYSIQDTLGDIRKSPAGAAIIDGMIAKASASRGDVAQSTAGNAALQKMMNKMTVQSLLKQAGDAIPPEAVKQLNGALQKIKKI
jgi:beta-galactosidase